MTLRTPWCALAAATLACGSSEDAGGKAAEAGGAYPLDALDRVTLHVNLGDSVGAGYNATGENAPSGKGYARLLFENHPDTPDLGGHTVKARYPGAEFADRAASGAQSRDVVGQSVLLSDTDGDVLVTIYVGGNDLQDSLATLLDPAVTAPAMDAWEANIRDVFARLRTRYEAPEEGRDVIFTLATVHEPTDATLSIPPEFTERFCGTLQTLVGFEQSVKDQIWANYTGFNDRIRAVAESESAILVDTEEWVVGHGLNSPESERWIDTDCTHYTDLGHHELRREVWRLLTGETP